MIDFTICHNNEPLNKGISVELPMNPVTLSDQLTDLGYLVKR